MGVCEVSPCLPHGEGGCLSQGPCGREELLHLGRGLVAGRAWAPAAPCRDRHGVGKQPGGQ